MVIAGKAKSKSKKKRRALCIGRAFKGGTGNNKKGKKARRIAPANVAPVPEEPVSASNTLPNTCAKQKARDLGAVRVSDHDHDVLMEEARRRDLLEHDELEEVESDEEAESEDEIESDMSEACDSESESE